MCIHVQDVANTLLLTTDAQMTQECLPLFNPLFTRIFNYGSVYIYICYQVVIRCWYISMIAYIS